MKEWLTPSEIAAEALPDLPATKRGVQLFAERYGWLDHPALARPRKGREGGGGTEFHIHQLPTLARIEYCRRHQIAGGDPAPSEHITMSVGATNARATLERDARLAIIRAFRRLSDGLALTQVSRLQIFTDRYNQGLIEIEGWILKAVPAVSKRSLARWLSSAAKGKALQLGHDPAAAPQGNRRAAHGQRRPIA
ncbi:DNA-binding protein [Mesorhizobium sp. J428]|uniref:DNA-binding protein n=1 Tax=Mesorhizobium sp. J428 TaxID=2898440 RepID=UPI002151113F|nr:DNA-binding protein [Mesorhizobium sp. J428]MCR5855959.1 hypothetical protein [Mesorhizobium sp. J428]